MHIKSCRRKFSLHSRLHGLLCTTIGNICACLFVCASVCGYVFAHKPTYTHLYAYKNIFSLHFSCLFSLLFLSNCVTLLLRATVVLCCKWINSVHACLQLKNCVHTWDKKYSVFDLTKEDVQPFYPILQSFPRRTLIYIQQVCTLCIQIWHASVFLPRSFHFSIKLSPKYFLPFMIFLLVSLSNVCVQRGRKIAKIPLSLQPTV